MSLKEINKTRKRTKKQLKRKRKKTQKMSKRLVISIDGGGTKGMFMFHTLSRVFSLPKFQPDLIVGVSAGAIVGSLYATGLMKDMTVDRIRAYLEQIFKIDPKAKKQGPWFQPSYSGRVKTMVLREIYGDILFGDVITPLAILVDTIGGDPVVYKSWDPEHASIPLVEILDATTAVPILFPPVKLGNQIHIDGGTVANSPTTIAYLTSKIFFPTEDIHMISVGLDTKHDHVNVDGLPTDSVGIVHLLAIGLPLHMMTRGPTLSNQLISDLMATKFIRIEGHVSGRIDDPNLIKMCKTISDNTWEEKHVQVEMFLCTFQDESSSPSEIY
jgi:predicted acylesterase/phospholipase RssA